MSPTIHDHIPIFTHVYIQQIHSIFANLLDFNAEEIMSLDKKSRTKSTLCAQFELPIDVLYLTGATITSTGHLDR